MLEKSQIIGFLKENKQLLLEKFRVIDIGLIGSYARDEQTEESDIDFLVEFSESKFDYWAGLVIFLEENFGKKVDVVMKKNLKRKSLIKTIERDIIYV